MSRVVRVRNVVFRDGKELVSYQNGDEVTKASHVKRLEDMGALVPAGEETETAPPEPITGDYASRTASELQAEAARRGLTVEGTGSGGNVLKDDLVKALEADDA